MGMPSPYRRKRPRDLFRSQVLGVYKGPVRKAQEPKLTPYRVTLLRATAAGEVKAGQGQYVGAWRWHHGGTSVTVTKWIREFVGCGWAVVVGAHLELTEQGRNKLAEAGEG